MTEEVVAAGPGRKRPGGLKRQLRELGAAAARLLGWRGGAGATDARVPDAEPGRRRKGRGNNHMHMPRKMIVAVTVVMLAGVVWAALAPVDRVVRAAGRLIPSERAQVVQHLEGGIVAGILVREGQIVERDAELLMIADVQAQSQVGERQVRLNALRAQLARLRAEALGGNVPAGAARGVDADAQREQLVLAARREKLEQSLSVVREQLDQRRQEVREAETRKKGLTREHALAVQQLAVVSDMIARQAASRLELLEAQSRVERFASQMQDIDASIPKTASSIRELEGRVAELGAQFRSDARTRLAEVEVEMRRLEEEVNAGKDRLERTAVRSPSRGVINKLYTNTVGGVVRAGEPLVEITPLDDRLTLEASIVPQDRGEVVVGLPAVIRLSAFDYAVYGTLAGKVSEVSADTLADERGNRFYRVRIDVDPESLRALGRELAPGMTATADVVLGQRTVLRYLMSPLSRFMGSALRDRN